MAEFPPPAQDILVGYFIVSGDIERSARFYTEVLSGRVVFSPVPTVVALANTQIVINTGGGPTDDKPMVALETPPDLNRVSSFINFRVKDIQGRVRRVERPRRPVPDPTETAPVRDPLLHSRSRRLPDRSGTDHRPDGRLVARSVVIERARRGL
jgi:hypothetical protein